MPKYVVNIGEYPALKVEADFFEEDGSLIVFVSKDRGTVAAVHLSDFVALQVEATDA